MSIRGSGRIDPTRLSLDPTQPVLLRRRSRSTNPIIAEKRPQSEEVREACGWGKVLVSGGSVLCSARCVDGVESSNGVGKFPWLTSSV